jgi:hypothetical protein
MSKMILTSPMTRFFEQEEHNNDDEHGHENPLEGFVRFLNNTFKLNKVPPI